MLRLTLRGLWSRKLRTALTFVVVMLGVSLMAGTLVLTDTIRKTFDDLFADVNRGTDVYVRGVTQFESSFGDTQRPRLDDSIVEDIEATDGVAIAEPLVQGYAQIIDEEGEPIGDPGFGPPTFGGNWSTVDELNPFTLVEGGRAPEADDELVIDKRSADDAGFEVGDTVSVQTQTGLEEYELVGVARFGTADSPGGATFALMTLPAAQQRVAQPGMVDSVSIVADDGVGQRELADRVQAQLGDDAEVLTGAEITEENQDDIEQGLQFFTGFLTAFAVIALVVGAFVIYNSFTILVAQRNREMALLRAVGASRGQVLRGVLLEAVIIGSLASAAGFLLGLAVTGGLRAVMDAFGFDLPAGDIIVVPAVRAARVLPIAAMRDAAVERTTRVRIRLVIAIGVAVLGALSLVSGVAGDGGIQAVGLGVLLIFTAAVLFGPVFAQPTVQLIGAPLPAVKGMVGQLARQNAARNPKRTAATASALLIGVAIIAFFLAFNSSLRASIDNVVDDQFVGDFAVETGTFGFGGLPPKLAEPDTIAVFEGRAEDKDWSVGDEIDVVFPQYGSTKLRVAMLYANKEIAGDYTIGFVTLERYVPDPADFVVFARLADGVDPDEARPALQAVTDDYPTGELLDIEEYKDATAEQFTPILGLVTVLMLLTIIIAVLGIMNTLALSVLERTRELGLVRAVGGTRQQVRSMIRWESVVITVLGSTIGLALGLFFAWSIGKALEEDGFTTYQVPYVGVAAVVVISALFGMLAALYPAWRAGRLDVLDAIATE